MLEIPIKKFFNTELLNNCIFMDIPGLNEAKANYIEDIFSIINLNNILFEIFIFDSNSFQSDKMLDIIKNLDKKNCLQKEGNIYILNKIDSITPGGEGSLIEKFKYHFYETFEKDGSKSSQIHINFYQNHFIPMNSILYNAEKKLEDDYSSWIIVELFYYINGFKNKEITSFYEHLEEKYKNILKDNNINEDDIENDLENAKNKEMNKIINCVKTIKDILTQTEKSKDFTLGINIEKKKHEKLMLKLFVLHKKKMIGNHFYSEYYEDLKEIIKNIKITKEDNLPSPPPVPITNKKEIHYKEDNILKEMNDFLREKLENQYEELNSNLRTINENIFGRKIRVSFIGPISVGKSTVLNCIIGKELLPSKNEECTYRGIIIKHDENLNDFYLYKVKKETINEGEGLQEFYNFKEEPRPYISGIKNIHSFLTNKNNDKEITNANEAFILIKGKLKIFEYIKLEKELIDKLEFIDLPGYDRENNEFTRNNYYYEILKFSNSCIYINTSENIEDKKVLKKMKTQYNDDKDKIFPLLKNRFIDTCLFLINKCDILTEKEVMEQTKRNYINIIKDLEPEAAKNINRINISFFSGKCFMEYLKYYEIYVTYMENDPIISINYLFNEWKSLYFISFKKYIVKKISEKIEDDFDVEIDELQTPGYFYNKLKNALNQIYNIKEKRILSNDEEEKEVINKLYNIYNLFKKKDFSSIQRYSHKFFDDIKKIILNSEQLQKENFVQNFHAFFQAADILFNRDIKKEIELQKKKGESSFNLFKNILIPETENLLNEKENSLKNIINSAKKDCLNKIDNEILNVDRILEEMKYDIEKAYSILELDLKKIIEKMKEEQEKIMNTIIDDIKKRSKEKIKSYYQSQNLPLDNNNIQIRIEETFVLFVKIIDLSLVSIAKILGITEGVGIGIAVGVGVLLSSSLALGGLALVALGLVGGFLIAGIFTTVSYFVIKYKKKSQYIENLEKCKRYLKNKFEEIEYAFSDHFRTFKDTLIKELKLKTEIFYKRINNDESEWKEIREKYESIKANTLKKVKEKYSI